MDDQNINTSSKWRQHKHPIDIQQREIKRVQRLSLVEPMKLFVVTNSVLAALVASTASAKLPFVLSGKTSLPTRWFGSSAVGTTNDRRSAKKHASLLVSTRGGRAPGAVSAEPEGVSLHGTVVTAEPLYLPGLLDTAIHRTNKVRYYCCGSALYIWRVYAICVCVCVCMACKCNSNTKFCAC